MVPSFKREELLPGFLDTFAKGDIPSLRRIVIMWHDNTTEPSAATMDSFASYAVPIVLERRSISLNERFRMSENVQTNCVLAIDDDMRYAAADVELGYEVWKEFGQGRRRMVGYIARGVVNGQYKAKKLAAYRWVTTRLNVIHRAS